MSERRRLNSSKLSLQSKSWSPSSTSASRHSCLHQEWIMKYHYTVSRNVHTRIKGKYSPGPELVAALPGHLLPLVRVEVGQQLLTVSVVVSAKQSILVHILIHSMQDCIIPLFPLPALMLNTFFTFLTQSEAIKMNNELPGLSLYCSTNFEIVVMNVLFSCHCSAGSGPGLI